MAAQGTSSLDPAAASEAQNNSLTNLLPQPVYQALRNHFLRPQDTVHVTQYFFQEWFPRLGLQRWLLVLLLREVLSRSDQSGLVRITREEVAAFLECSEKTVSDLLRHIPHPTRKGWRTIDPNGPDGEPDPRRQALGLFIPRLRYWYEKSPGSTAPPKRRGFIIAVSIDDPLTPEDQARMRSLSLDQISDIVAGDVTTAQQEVSQETETPKRAANPLGETPERSINPSGMPPKRQMDLSGTLSEESNTLSGPSLKGNSDPSGSLKGPNDAILLTLTELTNYIQENVNKNLTSTTEIRRAVAPLVQLTEEILADFHSTGMFYKVLCSLYPDHLDLFVQAVGEALEVGEVDRHANLGAIFVESIKLLAQQAGVDLGFAGATSEPAVDAASKTDPGGWTADGLWQQALSSLQLQMPKATFETWLRGTNGVAWNGDRLVVRLRNAQAQDWLEHRMQPKIVGSVRDLVGHDVQVAYETRSTA
ncbi:MAG: DnaA N-terminal domain-containing protein [Anaerolineae bacterium]